MKTESGIFWGKEFCSFCHEYIENNKILSFIFLIACLGILLFIAICFNKKYYIEHFWIPAPYIILFSLLYIIFYLTYFLYRFGVKNNINVGKSIIFWMFIIFIVSVFIWIFINRCSYYSGVKRGIAQQANTILSYFKYVYTNTGNLEYANRIFSVLPGEVYVNKIDKNGKEILIYHHKKFPWHHPENQYTLDIAEYNHSINESDGYITKYINGEIYRLRYAFISAPYIAIGVVRAITFSSFEFTNNSYYLGARLHHRSIYFWLAFFIFYFIFFFTFFINTVNRKTIAKNIKALEDSDAKKDKALNEKSEALSKLLVFQHTYDKIRKDFLESVNDTKNNLQNVQSSWDSIEKQSTKLERHDIINSIRSLRQYNICESYNCKINDTKIEKFSQIMNDIKENYDFNIIENIYDIFLEPAINKIQKELKGLETVLDLELNKYTLSEIQDIFIESTKENRTAIPKITSNKINLKKNINIDFNEYKCNVIMTKLKSIVFNIIDNSRGAILNYQRMLRHSQGRQAEKNYLGEIFVSASKVEKNSKEYLLIEVIDNAGGFPEEILNDIYIRPVPTTKERDKRKYGEATSYIGFFVHLMGGIIEATNIMYNEHLKGAKTSIFIPLYKECKNGNS